MPLKRLDEYFKQASTDKPTKITIQIPTQQKYKITGFYKETQFQETPIGKIPKEWSVAKLEYLSSNIYYGVTAKAVEKNTGIRMLRITDIKDYKVNWDSLPYCEITSEIKDIRKYLLEKGDIVVARAGTVGVSVLVDRDLDDVVFGSYLIKVRPREELVYPKFLHYYFQSEQYWKHISKAQGSTLKNINLEILKSLLVPLPHLEEQWGIAEVLSSVDQAIEATERFIEKLEKIKQGLMQELLTKGIGHKEFKETEIGKIPKEWDIVLLKEVAEIDSKPEKAKNAKGLVARIPMELIPSRGIYAKYELVNFDEVKSYTVAKEGDILLAKITPSFENGKQGIVPENLPSGIAFTTTEVYVITPRQIDKLFLFYLLKWEKVRKLLAHKMTGTTGRRRVPREALENLQIPLPSTEEQRKIASILKSIDELIEIESKYKERLERLKRGLMELLLTGRVRVRVERVSSG